MEKFIYFFNIWNPKVNVRMGWDYSSGIGPQQQPKLIFESTRPNSCSSNGTLGGSQIIKFGFSWPIRIGLKLEPRHNSTCSPISSMRTLQGKIILSSGLTWKRMNPNIKKLSMFGRASETWRPFCSRSPCLILGKKLENYCNFSSFHF